MPARTLTPNRSDRGLTLRKFLARELPALKARELELLLSQGCVSIGGKQARGDRKLWGNESVSVELAEAPRATRPAEPLPVLFEDEGILCLNKPTDRIAESSGDGRSIPEWVAAERPGLSVGGVPLPGVPHRLDRDTSGCLLLAKTDAALAKLQRAFVEKRVRKTYLCLVAGLAPGELRLETPYSKNPDNPRVYTTRLPSARRASLRFRTLETFGIDRPVSFLEVELETGRTHQIRAQLSDAGLPLLADPLYGSEDSRTHAAATAIGRLALHASSLQIAWEEGPAFSVQAPLPVDFASALSLLRSSELLGSKSEPT